MYFVHSYYVLPENKNIIISTTKYGEIEYCSSVMKDNIFACQYHPEKAENRLIYKNIKENMVYNEKEIHYLIHLLKLFFVKSVYHQTSAQHLFLNGLPYF